MFASNVMNRPALEYRRCSIPRLQKLNDRFFSVALRISWYSLSIIIINGFLTGSQRPERGLPMLTMIGTDLYSNETGGLVTTAMQGAIAIVYTILYGGRGIEFAAVRHFRNLALQSLTIFAARHLCGPNLAKGKRLKPLHGSSVDPSRASELHEPHIHPSYRL